jgi:hypothetical protein
VSELLVSTQGQVISATLTLAPDMLTTPSPAVSEIAPLEGATEVALAETPAVIEPTTVAENAPVQVVVVPRQRAWMRIIVDGEIVFEGRVVPGSAYSFGGNDRIELLTGDGASLQVYYNQQDLGIIGASGEVVEQVFSIAGVQTATPAVPPTLTPMPTGTIIPTPTPTGTGVSPAPSPTLRP